MSVQAPAPLTIFREAVSRGDRADAVLGASELVLGETGGGASLEYVDRRLESAGQERAQPAIALETLGRLLSIKDDSELARAARASWRATKSAQS